jgi:predicted nucleic acid-binding Zn ribbon protein
MANYINYKKKKEGARNGETMDVKQGLEAMLEAYNIRGKFYETMLVTSWEKIMGGSIAKRTEKLFIRDKKLFIKINSAPLKQELSMMKTKLVSVLNASIGENVIEDVVFI